MLFANTTTIRRRTVAHRIHGESIPDYALLDTEVDRIVFTKASNPLVAESVIFADGTISPVASDGKVGKVFLAANALGSAKVLARSDTRWSSFVFHNHFHTYSYIPAHAVGGPHKDVWQYEFTTPDVTITNLFWGGNHMSWTDIRARLAGQLSSSFWYHTGCSYANGTGA